MKDKAYPAALLAALMLSACAGAAKPTTPVASEPAPATPQKQTLNVERTQEVAYVCGSGQNKQSLRVMYGLSGNDVVAAQVVLDGKMTPVLLRDATDTDSNTFQNGPVTWNAHAANADKVDKVDGNMLTMEEKQTINGVEQNVSQIIVKYCALDKKTTARLNKAVAKPQTESTSGEAVNAMP